VRLAPCLLAILACGPPVRHPRITQELHPHPSEADLFRSCVALGGTEVKIAEDDPGAPTIVLQEVRLHGRSLPAPTVAIWADGRIVFARSPSGESGAPELRQGTISTTRVDELVRELDVALRSVPRSSSVHRDYVSGGQITTLAVRTGDHWLVASVYGAF
jgi:hypothetical protein